MIRKIYGNIRKFLPDRLNGKLSRFVFAFSKKPFVKKDEINGSKKFPCYYKGGMIISADFELGWGWRYARSFKNPYNTAIKMADQARKNFPFLLKLFEDFCIPITWATVGHLFLSECKKEDHDWMRRIPYFENRNWAYNSGDWFDCDPYTNWEKAKAWYAPDLIEKILKSKVNHEIGCHTFSHIDFSDKNCSPEVAEDEIKSCIEAAKKWGIELRSIVFPGGTYGNIEIIKKYGFKIYRKNIKFDLAFPFLDNYGLIVTPASAGFGNNNYLWSSQYFIERYKKYINRAIESGTICHFWFHPSIDEWFLNNVFTDILKYAAEKREGGKLWISSMDEIGSFINRIKSE